MTEEQLAWSAYLSVRVAIQRRQAHKGQESQQILSEDSDAVGLFGECKFSCDTDYRYKVDTSLRLGGDGGVDFYTPLGTVDVKTQRNPGHLLGKEGKISPRTDIFILAKFKGFTYEPEFLGWEVRAQLEAAPVGPFGRDDRGNPIMCHAIHNSALRSMRQFWSLLKRAEKAEESGFKAKCGLHGIHAGEVCLLCEMETVIA